MFNINLGPAGTGGTSEDGFKLISAAGFNAAEVEFTYGVWMRIDDAKKIGELAKKLKISLSIHAPYFINLASEEKHKVIASKKRILDSCERGNHLNATVVVFHSGFYGKKSKEETYQLIKEEILDLQKTIKAKKWDIDLAPETTGKASQFGDLDENLRLMKETGCKICIDFSHLKARCNGKIDYDEVFGKIKHLKHIHCHFSGIEFTEKGERKHLLTEEKDIKELLSYMKKYHMDATIINESPDPLGDSIKAKKILEKMK